MARTKTAGTFHEPKGYIYTDEGLCFSVLLDYMEVDRVLCWLRYRRTEQGLQKISIDIAKGERP